MDISPDLVELARRRAENYGIHGESLTLCVGSAYETRLQDESVDMVFSIALLRHFDLPRARQEIYRVLRPEGRLILREPIRFSQNVPTLEHLATSKGMSPQK